MPCASRIEQTPDATVVVKEASGAAAAALRAEGERLAAAAHPGVVRLLSSAGEEDRWELRTAHAGRPLDVGAPLPANALASVAAATATTLADLHDMGLVHGRLTASHILVAQSGRPVICGFGPGDAGRTPADDVGALGQIVLDQLAGDQSLEPIPERRWSRRRRWDGWARATLLNLAEQACADPPSRRPSARRFAAAISGAFDVSHSYVLPSAGATTEVGATSGGGDDPMDALRRTLVAPSRESRRVPLRSAVGIAAIVLGVALVVHSSTSKELLTEPTTTAQPTPRPGASVKDESPRPHRCPGSVCATPGQVTVDGTVVTTDRGRFRVGRDGDSVVVGDWDCDGSITPAVLRPSTGEVFVFPRWADGAEMAVGPVRTVADAATIEAVPMNGACAALQVRTNSGDTIAITRSLAL